jgi:hypothetical protein
LIEAVMSGEWRMLGREPSRTGGRFRGCRGRAVGGYQDFGFIGGTDPLALIVDVSERVNSAEHVTSGGAYGVGLLGDVAESMTQALIATLEKT